MGSPLTTILIIVNYLTGYLKENFSLEKMTDFSFSIEINMIDCLNHRKKQILYFLQLTKVLKTKRPTTVVFNVVHGSVWQAGRKMCLYLVWLVLSPDKREFIAQKTPQIHKVTEYQEYQHRNIPISSKSLPMALL